MKTPVFDFLTDYAQKKGIRMHMPGHKGIGSLGVEALDITEIGGADVLYDAKGIIYESQQNAAALFGTKKTVYSAEGSSLSIRAMLFLLKQYAVSIGRKPKILASRNAHSTFVSAVALLDIEVEWMYADGSSVLSCPITPKMLEEHLTKSDAFAVYITSPDYLGNIADIKGLSEVCKKHGAILAVDNAHGAYLKFLKRDIHPITLGADICCDSAHKTLPVLTGGGYLHISKSAPEFFGHNAQNAMKMFASTSPSYLILASLDKANDFLEGLDTADIEKELSNLKKNIPINTVGDEPFKITLCPKEYGYTGKEISDILEGNGIVAEFSDEDFCVLMPTFSQTDELKRLFDILSSLKKREPISSLPPKFEICERAISMQDAIFAPSERIAVKNATGRILCAPAVSCPPAVSVAVCGERLNTSAIKLLEYYSIDIIDVVK